MKNTVLKLLSLLLISGSLASAVSASEPQLASLPASCTSITAPLNTLIIQGDDIEAIMEMADNAYRSSILDGNTTPLTYRRCRINSQQALVIEPLSTEEAQNFQYLFEANIEGTTASIHLGPPSPETESDAI